MGTYELAGFKHKSVFDLVSVQLILGLCFSSVSGKLNTEDIIPEDDFLVYRSLEVTMKSVQPVLDNIDDIPEVVTFDEPVTIDPITKRYPIIAIEGIPLSNFRRIVMPVAHKLGARLISNPPVCLGPAMRILYGFEPEQRTALFSLGNYLAAKEMKYEVKQRPVIVTRYWYHNTAYAVALGARNISCLPNPKSCIYMWPKDLVAPDVSIFVNAKLSTLRHTHNLTKPEDLDYKLVATYVGMFERFTDPKPHILHIEKPFSWLKHFIFTKVMQVSNRANNLGLD